MVTAAKMDIALPNGIRLAADAFGPAFGRPVILAHGGGQTRHAWQMCGQRLGLEGYHAFAVDLRGLGQSDWAPDGDYRVERFSEDILDVADRFAEPPVLVGASLGGIAGMIAQGRYAKAGRRGFAGLVLVDITPRMSVSGIDKILGFMASNLDSGFETLEDAADAIARYIPNRPRSRDLSGLAKNLRLKEDGRFYWHWDPRFITSTQRPQHENHFLQLEESARGLDVPTLLIRGGNSELVSTEDAEHFAGLVPHSEFVDVAGAGHMVAGDRNDKFTNAILSFMRRTFPQGASEADVSRR
jgi:pimeloyl-ACP methyl ester carboxylesterase